jgi:hypothetical protein
MAMPMPRPPEPRSNIEQTSSPDAGRAHPDREAARLMAHVLDRADVARSFVKLAVQLLASSAARASLGMRTVADRQIAEAMESESGLRSRCEQAVRVARAATGAALHVATHRRAPPHAHGDGTAERDDAHA